MSGIRVIDQYIPVFRQAGKHDKVSFGGKLTGLTAHNHRSPRRKLPHNACGTNGAAGYLINPGHCRKNILILPAFFIKFIIISIFLCNSRHNIGRINPPGGIHVSLQVRQHHGKAGHRTPGSGDGPPAERHVAPGLSAALGHVDNGHAAPIIRNRQGLGIYNHVAYVETTGSSIRKVQASAPDSVQLIPIPRTAECPCPLPVLPAPSSGIFESFG